MQAYEIIFKKRNGVELSQKELEWFVDQYTVGEVTDYQAAAFCMAVFFRGMTRDELGFWTGAMLHSGAVLDFSELPGIKVDKHSTGGVGDKVSLPLAPLVAAAGVTVPMISGRGLGHTGGTLDKLESIPGFRTNLSLDEFRRQLGKLGVALIGQTAEIAPADKKLYSLRDVTATVDCIPLIASSIMSKKLAEGIDGLVLDVKVGKGAFMRKLSDAKVLAQTMIDIGSVMGKTIVARLTAMDQPLGNAVGNAIEVVESIDILKGGGPEDLLDVTLTLGAEMLVMAGRSADHDSAIGVLESHIADGSALEKFGEIIEAQGGDRAVLDDYSRLPSARLSHEIRATESGLIHELDALSVGVAARMLGAGRQTVDDEIDTGAGVLLHRKVGQPVERGDSLATLYASSGGLFAAAEQKLLSGVVVKAEPAPTETLLIDRMASD